MSRLTAALLWLLAVALVAVPLWFTVQGAGVARATSDGDRTVRSSGSRSAVIVGGGGIRAGK